MFDIINNCKNASNFENNNFLVFTFKKNSKNENFTLNINQNTIEKLVEIFDDFRPGSKEVFWKFFQIDSSNYYTAAFPNRTAR